jgi:hypothetical protein
MALSECAEALMSGRSLDEASVDKRALALLTVPNGSGGVQPWWEPFPRTTRRARRHIARAVPIAYAAPRAASVVENDCVTDSELPNVSSATASAAVIVWGRRRFLRKLAEFWDVSTIRAVAQANVRISRVVGTDRALWLSCAWNGAVSMPRHLSFWKHALGVGGTMPLWSHNNDAIDAASLDAFVRGESAASGAQHVSPFVACSQGEFLTLWRIALAEIDAGSNAWAEDIEQDVHRTYPDGYVFGSAPNRRNTLRSHLHEHDSASSHS